MACLGARSALAAGLSTFSFTSLSFPSRPVPQRLAYEARAQAIAAGNLTLPPLTAFVTLRELVHYIDSIFRSSLSHRGAVPYPGIAWSPDEVRSNAQRDEAGTPPPLPLYTEEAFWTPPRVTEERTDEALERLELIARQFSDTLDRMRPYPRAFEDLEHSIRVAAHALGGRGGRREGGPSRARTPTEEDFRYHRETIYRPPRHRSFSDVGGEGPDTPIDLSTVD